jgi:hypothetical protein
MSWRVSFYKADKNEPLTRELDHEDEYGTYENTYINGEEILNNEGTIFWTEKISREEKENPELFEQLWEDPSGDCDYYEVKRPGLKLFIEKYQQHIIKMYEDMLADPDNPLDGINAYAKRKLWNWQHDLVVNLRDDYKFAGVTFSDFYEYTIFNLIYLYHNFDFDNYKLVLYGG